MDGVTVDAPDALALAEFYAEITNGVATGSPAWAEIASPNGFIAFQQATAYAPPTWPGGARPMHMHLEFFVDDLEATGARVLAAGATLLDFQPNADHCFVYTDPAGHPFCLSTWSSSSGDPDPSSGADPTVVVAQDAAPATPIVAEGCHRQ